MYRIVGFIFTIAQLIILLRILTTWMPLTRSNQFVDLLIRITEPVLSPIRNVLNRMFNGKMFDFSGVIALLILSILRVIVLNIIA